MKYWLQNHQDSRSSLLWDVAQRRLALGNWRLGRTYLLHRQGSNSGGRRPIKLETIGYSEKSATHRYFTLRNNPEEWRSHLHRCGSLKSRTPRLNPNAQLLLSWRHVPYRCDTGCHPFRLQSSKINIYMNWQFIASCKMCQNLVSQPLRQNKVNAKFCNTNYTAWCGTQCICNRVQLWWHLVVIDKNVKFTL